AVRSKNSDAFMGAGAGAETPTTIKGNASAETTVLVTRIMTTPHCGLIANTVRLPDCKIEQRLALCPLASQASGRPRRKCCPKSLRTNPKDSTCVSNPTLDDLTRRISCGARAQPPVRHGPPARRQLQPVVSQPSCVLPASGVTRACVRCNALLGGPSFTALCDGLGHVCC